MRDPLRELKDLKTPFGKVRKWLETPPPGVPVSLLAEVVLRERDTESTTFYVRAPPKLSRPIVNAILDILRAEPPSLVSVFLLSALDETAPERDWVAAAEALSSLYSTLSWGSAPRRASFKRLAKGRFLPAFQAVAVAIADVPTELLTVLAADGSEASVDALMPHFQRAATQKDSALDQLERVKTHAAKTKSIASLLAAVDRLMSERNVASPALAFGRSLGFEDVETFQLHFGVWSNQLTGGGVPLYQCHADFDSTNETWFRVSVSKIDHDDMRGSLYFTNDGSDFEDPLKLGVSACSPAELPQWFAALGKKLKVGWDISIWNSNLRGKKRDKALAWMRGEHPSADVTQPSTRAKKPAGSPARSR